MENYKRKVHTTICRINNNLNDFKYLASLPQEHEDFEDLTLAAFEEFDALANICCEYLRNYYFYSQIYCQDLLDAIDSDARFPIDYSQFDKSIKIALKSYASEPKAHKIK